ncbi:MAG: hypothetical protein AAF074_16065 [Pseudomonadota bacterium]
MTRLLVSAAAAGFLASPFAAPFATPVAAQESGDPPAPLAHPENRAHAAWNAFNVMDGGILRPADRTTLISLAWHAAMANLCPGIFLDHERFGAAFATIEHADYASLTAAEHAYFRHHIAVNFGVATGILLAEMGGTPEEIVARCAEVHLYAENSTLGPIYFDVEATLDEALADAPAPEAPAKAE